MYGINLFAKAEKHLRFQGIEKFPFHALLIALFSCTIHLIDFEENYVINGSIRETMFQYVFAFPN